MRPPIRLIGGTVPLYKRELCKQGRPRAGPKNGVTLGAAGVVDPVFPAGAGFSTPPAPGGARIVRGTRPGPREALVVEGLVVLTEEDAATAVTTAAVVLAASAAAAAALAYEPEENFLITNSIL